MNKKLLRKKLALMLANLKKKRPFYTEIEYIENTGTASARNWINTGIVPDTTTRWEVRVAFNNTTTGKLMGSGYTTPNRFNLGIESSKFRFGFNGWFDANSNITTPDTNAHTWIMDAPSKTFSIDEYSTTTTQNFGASTFPICLFGRCNNASGNTETSNAVIGKIYYTKIWQNGVLVCDMIPVLDWDMTPCMYDKVSGELFYNKGTGDFVAGRQIHPVEYLESTGTQYINTDTTFQVTDEVYFKGALLTRSNDKFVLSAQPWNNNNNRYSPLGFYANRLIAAFGNMGTPGSYYSPELNNSDVHTITYKNKVFTMEDTGATYTAPNTATFGGETGKIKFFYGYNAPSVARIDAYKQWRDGVLICDFIPMVDELGVGAMFDRVSHTIYDNAGTGAGFNYPPVELEYIESDGTQYIDTGVVPTSSMNAKIDFYVPQAGATQEQHVLGAMGGSGITNGGRYQFLGFIKSLNKWRTAYGQLNPAIDNWGNLIYDEKVHFDITLQNGTSTVYINNSSTPDWTFTYEADVVTPSSIYLFALNNGGSRTLFATCRVYSCSISHDGVLLRDFIPCFKDGSAGMWDKVNSVFYPNAGTGSFVVGVVREPEYE